MAEVDRDTVVGTYDVALHVMCIGTGEAAGVAEILARQLVGLSAEGWYATLSVMPSDGPYDLGAPDETVA